MSTGRAGWTEDADFFREVGVSSSGGGVLSFLSASYLLIAKGQISCIVSDALALRAFVRTPCLAVSGT